MTQYYDDTAKDYAERAEAAAESASQSKQQATTAATTAATQANIATNAAQNAAVLVKSELENDVRAMKDAALSAASQASANASAAAGSAVDARHDAIDADQARQAAQAAQTAAETAQTAAETAMGNAASSAGAAAASAQAAATSETNASGSASAAATSESNAADSESNAETSAQNAATSEENSENSAKLSQSWAVGGTGVRDDEDTNNAQYYAELAEHFSPVSKADKVTGGDTDGMVAGLDAEGNLTNTGIPAENVAQKDGYYEDMTVGRAENLIDPQAPATSRKFGFDTACGDISITDNGNAIIKTMYGTTYVMNQLVPDESGEYDIELYPNTKYLYRDVNGDEVIISRTSAAPTKTVHGGIDKLINLTIWFGYKNEPTIQAFYKLFPTWKGADIPYIRGRILSYKGTGVQTVGFNAYNHATGTAELLGGNKYQICGTYTSVSYVDQWGEAEELKLDDQGIFTPANNGVITVVGGNATDTCIHLCWSGYKNFGEPDYKWEPFIKNIKTLAVSDYFQTGMQGFASGRDELTATGYVQRYGIKVFDGTENWSQPQGPESASLNGGIPDMANGYHMTNVACNLFIIRDANHADYAAGTVIAPGIISNKSLFLFGISKTTGSTNIADLKTWIAARYAEGNPMILVYPLATPVVTTFDQHLNLTYPVNDFGTEQSLPINTTELLSTDLDADIQYSIDFTRTVQHYSEIEKDVEGLVAEKDNLARQDGDYATKGLGAKTAQQLVDPNAPATERAFGFDTACGDITIADNGTASPEKLMGTTHVANQLVHDTNMNTKSSTDGKLAVTDAVGGQLSKLEIHGGCVVHNQLVKESVAKTVSGTGRLGCSDGVAGNAESFVMTAPRSVVVNQQVSANIVQSNSTINETGGVWTCTASNRFGGYKISSVNIVQGHVYALRAPFKPTTADTPVRINLEYFVSGASLPSSSINTAGTWNYITAIVTCANSRSSANWFFQDLRTEGWDAIVVDKPMLVDLTQYFNGNTTLINAITSWDDLVAYDPSFASYVPYNTGTVKGVQPTVKVNHTTDVACPVELFGLEYNTGNIVSDSFDAVSGTFTNRLWKFTITSSLNKDLNYVEKGEKGFRLVFDTYRSGNPGLQSAINVCSRLRYKSDLPYTAVDNNIGCFGLGASRQIYMAFAYTTVGAQASDTNADIINKTWTYLTSEADAGRPFVFYFRRTTPTTSQYTPTVIPTVDIYNSAVQTSNERLAALSMTYHGREQTIALDPTHTYVFNDNQTEDSVITNESSIDAVGGEDMLVDVTQLYNGDSTKISQIQRWASLSTRFHRYRDLMPYNPGTVEPDTPVVRNYPDEYAYGVIYDPNQSSPACVKVELHNGVVSEVTDFASMPCHQLYRCVMDDLSTRHIAYYLDDEDSNKKYNGTRNGVTSDGTASVLTGADGDVMVEIPISYWYLDEDWNGEGKVLWLISDRPFMGTHGPAEIHDFFYVSPDGATCRKQYVGAYRGCVCDAEGNPLNTTEGALTQTNGVDSTNTVHSIAAALPGVGRSLTAYASYASRVGGNVTNHTYHQWLMLLMVIEKGSLDNQLISVGYSFGYGTAFCFFRKSGRVNAGNGTAELLANVDSQDMDNFQAFKVGSTTVQRDTLMDANGRYAWSIYNRNASSVRYFTASPTPVNGDTVYSASTGDTSAGTVSSYTIRAENLRVHPMAV